MKKRKLTEQLPLFRPYYNKNMEELKMMTVYIAKQNDGTVLSKDIDVSLVIQEVIEQRIEKFERYYNHYKENLELNYYIYIGNLNKLYNNIKDYTNELSLIDDFYKAYNNENFLDSSQIVRIET
ncbi:hypothetical protein [Staphylococcus aureus]|uniref:hypothetical protein n=2 Tax=Staphylococcus aureus TaxID=1280 RepID=UPI001CBA6035|nr:hypothetical protein [Staphylococcus aureus]